MKNPTPNYAITLAKRPGKTAPVVDEYGYASIEATAAYFDMEPKRLRGYVFRNEWMDPIGDAVACTVYPFTVERFLAYQAKLRTEPRREV